MRATASWEAAPDDIDALMEVNIKGALHCLAATVPGMKARGLGHIVNLSSIAAAWPIPGMPVYAMTKAALRNLSQTLRLDLHGCGVRVSEISPGRVETGAHLALLEDREEGRPALLRRLRVPAARRHRRGRHVRAGRAAAHGRELHGDRADRPVLRRLAIPSARCPIGTSLAR